MKHTVSFINGQKIQVGHGENLSSSADITTCPVLFGCRTGICGTCLVLVSKGEEHLSPASDDEKEFLDIVASGQANARLACQLNVEGDLELEYLGK
jgi:ferredoxin